MRSFFTTAFLIALAVIFRPGNESVKAEVFYVDSASRPVVTSRSPVVRSVVPTSLIVERPVVISESAPMLLSPPMSRTVLSYDLPVSRTITTGAVTSIVSSPVEWSASASDSFVEESPMPLSVGANLKPLLPKNTSSSKEGPSEEATMEFAADFSASEPSEPLRFGNDEVVSTEKPKAVAEPAPRENPFEGIMTPRELAVRTLVAKPPRESLKPQLRSESKPPLPIVSEKDVSESVLTPPKPLHLGQSGFRRPVEEALSEPLPRPEGSVDLDEIHPKLTDTVSTTILPDANDDTSKGTTTTTAVSGTKKEWVNGALLLTTIVATIVAGYAIILAFEFRQRWMQTVTEQNTRFSMPFNDGVSEFDYFEGSDTYGLPLYGGISDGGVGLSRYGSEMLGSSTMRY